MIRSMTGFGRGITTLDERKYTVEIKTVNHRYMIYQLGCLDF